MKCRGGVGDKRCLRSIFISFCLFLRTIITFLSLYHLMLEIVTPDTFTDSEYKLMFVCYSFVAFSYFTDVADVKMMIDNDDPCITATFVHMVG